MTVIVACSVREIVSGTIVEVIVWSLAVITVVQLGAAVTVVCGATPITVVATYSIAYKSAFIPRRDTASRQILTVVVCWCTIWLHTSLITSQSKSSPSYPGTFGAEQSAGVVMGGALDVDALLVDVEVLLADVENVLVEVNVLLVDTEVLLIDMEIQVVNVINEELLEKVTISKGAVVVLCSEVEILLRVVAVLSNGVEVLQGAMIVSVVVVVLVLRSCLGSAFLFTDGCDSVVTVSVTVVGSTSVSVILKGSAVTFTGALISFLAWSRLTQTQVCPSIDMTCLDNKPSRLGSRL